MANTKTTQKLPIKYPKEVFVIPDDYQAVVDDYNGNVADDVLMIYDKLDEAEELSGMDEGEAWIAVYTLTKLVRVKSEKKANIVDEIKV